MRIGYVCAEDPGETDRLIAAAVAVLEAEGIRLAGAVQSNPARADRKACDMVLRILPSGPSFRISADRGALARGCRLDSAALEEAALLIEPAVAGASLLVVNKFGKQEAMGRGLVPAMGEAVALGIPVLAGVGRRNLEEFARFTGGAAERLATDAGALIGWARAHCLRLAPGA